MKSKWSIEVEIEVRGSSTVLGGNGGTRLRRERVLEDCTLKSQLMN